MKVAAVLIVLAAAPAGAEPRGLPRNADALCDHTGPGVALTFNRDGTAFLTEDASDPKHAVHTVAWRGRLDPDHRRDLILLDGGCGRHECLHTGYLQCDDGTYVTVFTEYAARVRVLPRRGGWATIQLEHVGDPDASGHTERMWDTLRRSPDGYNGD